MSDINLKIRIKQLEEENKKLKKEISILKRVEKNKIQNEEFNKKYCYLPNNY